MKRILLIAVLAGAVACSRTGPNAAPPTTKPAHHRAVLTAALQPADGCSDLLGWIRTNARDEVGPYGFDSGYGYAVPLAGGDYSPALQEKRADTPSAPTPSTEAADSAASSTGTNDQEAGVDEPDQFKSDGTHAVMTDGQRLMVVDLGSAPTKAGEIDLPMSGARLFLRGDQVLAAGAANDSSSDGGDVEIVTVDISTTPKITSKASVEGQLVDGREAGGVVRLVVTTPEPNHLSFVNPGAVNDGDGATTARATAENRAALDQSTIAQWLPSWTSPSGARAQLEGCGSVFHPNGWSGAAMLSVLSIGTTLDDLHAVGVFTSGQTVYASTSALYVATQPNIGERWADDGSPERQPAQPAMTDIHRFDISQAGSVAYEGSGEVWGSVADQYSMSEQDGDLRVVSDTSTDERIVEPGGPIACPADAMCALPRTAVASDADPTPSTSTSTSTSTTSPPTTSTTTQQATTTSTVPPTPAPAAGTLLSVLRLQGDQLATIGRVDGIAPGENVKAVRFIGSTAYVVTFRNYDPLFVIDITDPTAPKLLGQLTTPGFSAYLHPVAANLLFGVGTTIGSDSEPNGSTVSLYDTSDPLHPTQISQVRFPGSGTDVGNDTHAFTWDPDHHLAFVATDIQTDDGREADGMAVYRVDGRTINWIGFISHADHDAVPARPPCPSGAFCPDAVVVPAASPVDRVIVSGDQVLAASDDGVSIRPIDTLTESQWFGW